MTRSLTNCARGYLFRSFSSCFSHVEAGPPDPILGLTEAFKRDPRPHKINLSLGAYRDDDGRPYLLPSVQQAEQRVVAQHANKEYAPISGLYGFCDEAAKLALGRDHAVFGDCRNATVQSISGSGALYIASKFLRQFYLGNRVVWAPFPTWQCHEPVFRSCGMPMNYYRYYDSNTGAFDEKGALEDIEQIPECSIILLHACAHNPTGADPKPDQWIRLSDAIKRRRLYPLFDLAYQGISSGDVDEDAFALRRFVADGHQLCFAQSFSKNMGLYGERVGALTVVCESAAEAEHVWSQLKILIRPVISNPPLHGARIAQLVLADDDLRQQWLADVKGIAQRIISMRHEIKRALVDEGSSLSWQHLVQQTGMFCYTGMDEHMVDRLKEDFAVYLTRDGRISVASLARNDIPYLANAIHQVTSAKHVSAIFQRDAIA